MPAHTRPRLVLHIGMPKSGTTSLQALMSHQREALAAAGIWFPAANPKEHFLAALEMTGKHGRWGRSADEVRGTFARLLAEGRASGAGTVVVSHEIFAQALPEQVPEILRACEGFDLRVVITVRDLARVLPAAWQEWVKNGHRGTFDDFVALKARRLPGGDREETVFWRIQNVAEVLDRWLPHVSPEQVHVVACPPVGAPADELWRRFADAVGCSPDVVDHAAVPRSNESIPAAQVVLLAGVNRALKGRLEEPWGERLRKHWLAEQLLARAEGEKAVASRASVELFGPVAQEWVQRIATSGVVVHGELDELVPQLAPEGSRHPGDVTAEEQLREVPEAMAAMLLRIAELEREVESLRPVAAVAKPAVRVALRLRRLLRRAVLDRK